MNNTESQRECADRVFLTVGQVGFQHPIVATNFLNDGVRITFDGWTRLYGEEISALMKEFDNTILSKDGLVVYDENLSNY